MGGFFFLIFACYVWNILFIIFGINTKCWFYFSKNIQISDFDGRPDFKANPTQISTLYSDHDDNFKDINLDPFTHSQNTNIPKFIKILNLLIFKIRENLFLKGNIKLINQFFQRKAGRATRIKIRWKNVDIDNWFWK